MKTAHEKKLELAKASAPKYGIYIDGGNVDALIEAMATMESILSMILNSDSEEKTKRDAIQLVKDASPSVNNASIANCSVNMSE